MLTFEPKKKYKNYTLFEEKKNSNIPLYIVIF